MIKGHNLGVVFSVFVVASTLTYHSAHAVTQEQVCAAIRTYCSDICDDSGAIRSTYLAGTWRVTEYPNPIYVGSRTIFQPDGQISGRFTAIYPTTSFNGEWKFIVTDGGGLAIYIEPEGRALFMSEAEKIQEITSCTENILDLRITLKNNFTSRFFSGYIKYVRE